MALSLGSAGAPSRWLFGTVRRLPGVAASFSRLARALLALPGSGWGNLPFVLSVRVLGRGLIEEEANLSFHATVGVWEEATEGSFWLLSRQKHASYQWLVMV